MTSAQPVEGPPEHAGNVVLRVYVAWVPIATWVAVRRGLGARFAGIRFPGAVPAQALVVGTGASAPLPVALFAWSVARRPCHLQEYLAALFLVGALGEPVTWQGLRAPFRDRVLTITAATNVVLPALALFEARRARADYSMPCSRA